MPKSKLKTLQKTRKATLLRALRCSFWFGIGSALGLFFFLSFFLILFQRHYTNVVYPGVLVDNINFGGRSQDEVRSYFAQKNDKIAGTKFVIKSGNEIATVSAAEIHFGYDENTIAQQAYSIGRSPDILSNFSLITQAYFNSIILPPIYHFDEEALGNILKPMIKNLSASPTDALFTFENGRVVAFRPSSDGQEMNMDKLEQTLSSKSSSLLAADEPQIITIVLPIKILHPNITTDKANHLGIKELIGSGTSLFQGSISSRVYNVELAATRLNGALVAPGETFSFDKTLGDISAFTGYKQAYVISNGRTVLGDGGGVCQVSTTLFRAILNTGLPVVERHAHAYRVEYYEEDSPPGIDATIYSPTVDLKFKNDTGNYILIQSSVDPAIERLTFNLYGTSDGRQSVISTPVVSSQTPPPDPLYQDDPTLPAGTVKQVDFSAWGANVSFGRTVTRNGKTIISETYYSNYQPWRAVYLRGTKSS